MGDRPTCLNVYLKINCTDLKSYLRPPKHSLLQNNLDFLMVSNLDFLKIKEEHGRYNRAITTVADAALDSNGCLRLSQSSRDTAKIFNWVGNCRPQLCQLGLQYIFFSCLLCCFQYSLFYSFILLCFYVGLISFLLYPCATVWKNSHA